VDLAHEAVEVQAQLARLGRLLEERVQLGAEARMRQLGRDESIRFQLAAGKGEHRRHFGRPATGCWLPECAYRAGLEDPIREAGFGFFFVDAHMAQAGRSLGLYGEPDVVDGLREPEEAPLDAVYPRSPYRAYDLNTASGETVAVFVRDPATSLRVWSRHQGYPGDAGYLEFHKIRWPGGLKFWSTRLEGVQYIPLNRRFSLGFRLQVGDSDHPMAQRLRYLGLDNARPLIVFSCDDYQARMNAGVTVDILRN